MSQASTHSAGQLDAYLLSALQAAIKAGQEILLVYASDFRVEFKDDSSPLTKADKNAHEAIARSLAHLGIPLLSEEGSSIPYAERKDLPLLWIVDPLDGTKEFVKKNGEFTVNIALIQNHRPVLGVIYQPTTHLLYWGCEGQGAYKRQLTPEFIGPDKLSEWMDSAQQLPLSPGGTDMKVSCSRSHLNEATSRFVSRLKKEHDPVTFVQAGSSLKFCHVAEGTADLYPRFGPTMEWDTAAGQAIVTCAGGTVLSCDTRQEMNYNREELRNGSFLVTRQGRDGSSFI